MREIHVSLVLLLLVAGAAVVASAAPPAQPPLSNAAFLRSLAGGPAAPACARQGKAAAGVATPPATLGDPAPLFDAGGGEGNPASCFQTCCPETSCCNTCCTSGGHILCTDACPC